MYNIEIVLAKLRGIVGPALSEAILRSARIDSNIVGEKGLKALSARLREYLGERVAEELLIGVVRIGTSKIADTMRVYYLSSSILKEFMEMLERSLREGTALVEYHSTEPGFEGYALVRRGRTIYLESILSDGGKIRGNDVFRHLAGSSRELTVRVIYVRHEDKKVKEKWD